MGDSLLSPPLAVKTPYNKTDLDEFRDSLGEQSWKLGNYVKLANKDET